MTFSEFIKTKALEEYLAYCKNNNITPVVDIKIIPKKLCALVKPKLDPKL